MAAAARREQLWRTASTVAAKLKREGVRAVAVSGSLARGDDTAASDVDLWAIGASSGRDERFVRGVPVTVFRSRPDELRALGWVNQWDVERLVVLFDTRGDFKGLKRRYAKHRAQLHAEVERGIALHPVPAWRHFALAVFRATGIRVPKWKHAVALLPAAELNRLRKALRLPARIDREALLERVREAPERISALTGERVPRWAAAEAAVQLGSVEEAVLKVRADLHAWLPEDMGDPALNRLRRSLKSPLSPRGERARVRGQSK